jgi:hypothetical protein
MIYTSILVKNNNMVHNSIGSIYTDEESHNRTHDFVELEENQLLDQLSKSKASQPFWKVCSVSSRK